MGSRAQAVIRGTRPIPLVVDGLPAGLGQIGHFVGVPTCCAGRCPQQPRLFRHGSVFGQSNRPLPHGRMQSRPRFHRQGIGTQVRNVQFQRRLPRFFPISKGEAVNQVDALVGEARVLRHPQRCHGLDAGVRTIQRPQIAVVKRLHPHGKPVETEPSPGF